MSSPFTVLVATTCHPPLDARIVFREMAALSDASLSVTYAAPFADYQCRPIDGVDCINLPGALSGKHSRAAAIAFSSQRLLRLAPNFDAIIIHDPDLLPALFLIRARWGKNAPALIWDVHEDVPAQVEMTSLPSLAKKLVRAGISTVERFSESLFELFLAEVAYQDRFRNPHLVVPNTIVVPADVSVDADDPARVVYLGAVTRARGLHEMIECARMLPEVTFQVIGNAKGDDLVTVEQADQVLTNFDYLGFVPNAEALRHISGAICGLGLLHDIENYHHSKPTKLLEYMAHGVPVITTPNPASQEIVEQSGAGFVVDYGDVDATVAAIRQLIDKPELRREMGLKAHSYASRTHNWATDGELFSSEVRRLARESAHQRRS